MGIGREFRIVTACPLQSGQHRCLELEDWDDAENQHIERSFTEECGTLAGKIYTLDTKLQYCVLR